VADYVSIARQVGARLIRFVIDDSTYHPAPDTVTGVLLEISSTLGDLTLGIENHDRFSAATLRDMIEKAGSENIGVCLDTANSLGAGEGIEAVAAVLAPLTINLHIKDFSIERVPHLMGFHVTGRPAGGGMLNLPALLEQLAQFNRCQTAVLELWTPPEPQMEQTIAKEAAWAGQSLQYLKPLFAKC
jgi:sugar phosphate isomerase/epimerase